MFALSLAAFSAAAAASGLGIYRFKVRGSFLERERERERVKRELRWICLRDIYVYRRGNREREAGFSGTRHVDLRRSEGSTCTAA